MSAPHRAPAPSCEAAAPCEAVRSEPDARFETETTALGVQTLVPGVTPITPLARLLLRAAAPLEPEKPQRPCDLGLFDLGARNQLSLFDRLPPRDPDGGMPDG